MRMVLGGLLSIKTKSSELIKLIPNNAQTSLISIIKELQDKGLPIRIWVLKARQEGVSTIIEAITFAYTSQRPNVNSLILADIKDHANNLFEMTKLYYERLLAEHPHLAPKIKKSNEKKLEFEKIHSQAIIASAENTEAAKSHTFQICHLSECAFFRDFTTIMNYLNQTVPELPGTMIIGETTANGMNKFYDEYKKAVEGKTSWIPVFIPWFAMPEYSLPLVDGKFHGTDGINFDEDEPLYQFLENEQKLKEEHSLSDEQLNWRRYFISNKCQGDMSTFRQEYPSCWKEAFKMSGSSFFDKQGMDRQKKSKPIKVGEILFDDQKHRFRDMISGRIKVYDTPVSTEEYIVTGDASEAIGEDEGSLFVGNKRLNKTVAIVNGQYPPEDLAHLAEMLGYYYNNAIVAIENKGYGYMVNQLLFKKYGNIYRKKITKDGRIVTTDELGFNTNIITRPEMLGRLAEEVRLGNTHLVDEDLIDQCGTFIINPKSKKPEAAEGKEDGLVICRAIFSQVRHEHPYRPREDEYSVERLRAMEQKDMNNAGFSFK